MQQIYGNKGHSTLIWFINNYGKELGFYFLFGKDYRGFRAGIDDSNFLKVGRCRIGSEVLRLDFRRYRVYHFKSLNKYFSYMVGVDGDKLGDYFINVVRVKYREKYLCWTPQEIFLGRLYYEFKAILRSRSGCGDFKAIFFGPLIRKGGFPGFKFT